MNASAPLLIASGVWGMIGTFAMRALALRTGFVNHPNAIVPQHVRPVAYLGGAGIAIGVLGGTATVAAMAAMGWVQVSGGELLPLRLALPAGLFLALGVLDDRFTLSAGWKFLLQGALAALAAALGVRHTFTGSELSDAVISAFGIVLVVNAFNLTDVCDGLVAGIAALTFVALARMIPEAPWPVLAAAGACVGFLRFNFPPASIFLGDAGSHLLGFLVAAGVLLARPGAGAWPYAAQAALLCGVPLFELTFLVVVRARRGMPWWKGSPDHFSLRLQQAGLSKLRTDLVAWGAAAVGCGLAVAMTGAGTWGRVAILTIALSGAALFWIVLLKHEVTPAGRPAAAESVGDGSA